MNNVKKIIMGPLGPILRHFDLGLPIQLLTYALRTGIGYILVQEDQTKAPRLITFGSLFIGAAEKNHALVELEYSTVGSSEMSPVPRWSVLHNYHGSSTNVWDHQWQESRRYQQRPNPASHVQDAQIQFHGRMERWEEARHR